jgi:hypothetical protein
MSKPNRDTVSFRGIIILGGYLIVAICELFAHWYMSKSYPFSNDLLHWYIYQDPVNGKGHSDELDIVMPSILIGALIGFFARRAKWSFKVCIMMVLLSTAGVTAMLPITTLILGKGTIFWWPQTKIEALFMLYPAFVEALLVTGFFTYGIVSCSRKAA